MRKHNYTLSDGAQADLREILQYTTKIHGKKQAIKFKAELITHFEGLCTSSSVRPVNNTGLLYFKAPYHNIYFSINNNIAEIFAIFHQSMDIPNRLKHRI